MAAELIQERRYALGADRFVAVSIWRLAVPLPPSTHNFKYRLALVANGVCVLRYDNERGKGDHKHLGEQEVPYTFISLDHVVDDFWADVARY